MRDISTRKVLMEINRDVYINLQAELRVGDFDRRVELITIGIRYFTGPMLERKTDHLAVV